MGCLNIDKVTDLRENCVHFDECGNYGWIQVAEGKVCQKCFDKYGYGVPKRGLLEERAR